MKLSILILLFSALCSCEEFVQVGLPSTKIATAVVFEDDKTATAATLAMYEMMQRIAAFGSAGSLNSVTTLGGLSADEFRNFSADYLDIADNNLPASNPNVLGLWSTLYHNIYIANSVIEGVQRSNALTPATAATLEGETKFMRAFCYFYLVNFFGDVPLATTTDYRTNSALPRTTVSVVYDQITKDLTDARNLLPQAYSSADRGRPNYFAATALLARVLLYKKDYAGAEQMVNEVIAASSLYNLSPLPGDSFLIKSTEALWQLVTTATTRNTWEGRNFILISSPMLLSLSDELVNSFEPGDKRFANWIGTFQSGANVFKYANKYKQRTGTPVTEHSVILRLSEMFLIRAEARTMLNNTDGARSDIDRIRDRAGLGATTAQTQDELLRAILQERNVELFTEWGHRWLDLKRMGKAEEFLAPLKNGWSKSDELYPIPEAEMLKAPSLTPQNPGY
jgi:hypothetical protein